MDKLTPMFSVETGDYMNHPSVRGLIQSGLVTPDFLRNIWNTPYDVKTFSKNKTAIDSSKSPLKLMIVTYGWFFSYSKLPNGQRQVHRIYMDGDIIGDDDFSRTRNSFSIESATESRAAVMDVPACRALLKQNANLLDYLTRNLSHSLLLSMDHAKSISRLQTKERLAHFILSMLSRIRWMSAKADLQEIRIPLNQSVISDYLGLTNVHVSRTLKTLEAQGLIVRPEPNLYRILDETTLVKMSGFIDRQQQFSAEIAMIGHQTDNSVRRT